MADPTLMQFVRESLSAGASRADIRKVLIGAGWPDDQADDALARFAEADFPIPVPRPQADGSAREAFLYIVHFALLGAVATSVGAIAFAAVDLALSDALSASSRSASGLRWQVAWLIVGYPIFIFSGARLAAARRKDPNRRASRVKAWLTYVTLVFAALALIGDFVAVVFQFLDGELSARFLSKAGVVAAIAGAILFVYSRDAERRVAGVDYLGRVIAIATSVIVALLVAWAFTIVRSPSAARAERADERRLADIQSIVRLVDCHASYFGGAPETLQAAADRLGERASSQPIAPNCALSPPEDPVTGEPYVFRSTGAQTFEVCATFERGWPRGRGPDDSQRMELRDWRGSLQGERSIELPIGAGPTCYDFAVAEVRDPDETD
ncbi:MAG: hypothetical protein GC152_14650 [Alphaproteobacteria bacterium]|nr:hypothetical protein [Alphaproteobacteria bacterium]